MNQENNKKSAFNGRGFYAILAVCLLAIGAAGFFAASPVKTPEATNNNSEEYSEPQSSYNEPVIEEPVQNPISDQPYSSTPEPTQPLPEVAEPEFINPIKNGEITKKYDAKNLQYSATFKDMRIHLGTDILCDAGSDVLSSESGTVRKVYTDASLGKVIEIDHSSGIVVKYCGLADNVTVSAGEAVVKGHKLGTVSSVPGESADAVHLHIEVTVSGKTADPQKVLNIG